MAQFINPQTGMPMDIPQNPGQPWYMQPWQGQPQQRSINGPQNPSTGLQGVSPGVYPANNQPGFKVIPVTSYDEAKAVPTDFMGNLLIMPDIAHGYIYTKIFNQNTGGSIFTHYRMVTMPDTPTPTPSIDQATTVQGYDAKAEIDQLRAELTHIKKELGIDKEDTE